MIPDDLATQASMLAHPHKNVAPTVEDALKHLITRGDQYFDIKWDGVRSFVEISDGKVRFRNRRNADITYRYPDLIVPIKELYGSRTIVLDGEVIVYGADGRPDFAGIHRRDAQQNPKSAAALVASLPATFVAFDILYADETDYRRMPYAARRGLLSTEARETFSRCSEPNRLAISQASKDGQVMWDLITEHRLEGLIAKAASGPYVGGRSASWIKLKPTRMVSALVSGVDAGKGWREDTFGALHLCLLNERSELVPIGKVGTGFKQADLDIVQAAINEVTAGTREMLVVDVEYQDATNAGQLRFPSFRGIRMDVPITDCTLDQLDLA